MSLGFMSVILFISRVIMLYSFNYISPYAKPYYFLWLTMLFVVSILLVVAVPHLFYVILG